MKTIEYYDVVDNSYGGPYDCSFESLGKYSTYDEAKKHFDWFVKNNVKDNEVFNKHITELSEDRCSYNDGGSWSYSVEIQKMVFELNDKFNVEDYQ